MISMQLLFEYCSECFKLLKVLLSRCLCLLFVSPLDRPPQCLSNSSQERGRKGRMDQMHSCQYLSRSFLRDATNSQEEGNASARRKITPLSQPCSLVSHVLVCCRSPAAGSISGCCLKPAHHSLLHRIIPKRYVDEEQSVILPMYKIFIFLCGLFLTSNFNDCPLSKVICPKSITRSHTCPRVCPPTLCYCHILSPSLLRRINFILRLFPLHLHRMTTQSPCSAIYSSPSPRRYPGFGFAYLVSHGDCPVQSVPELDSSMNFLMLLAPKRFCKQQFVLDFLVPSIVHTHHQPIPTISTTSCCS